MLTNFKDHLHRGGNLSVSIYTLFTRKNKNTGNAIHGEYINTYQSSQYNNVPFLSEIENNGNHYISFSYNKFQQGQAPIREDVLISYPHLQEFNNFLKATYTSISENFNNIFSNNQVTPEYQQHIWQSPKLVSGKEIAIAPAVIQNNRTNNFEIGFNIMVNDTNKYDFVSSNTFISLVTLLARITNDPLTFRNQCVQAEMQAKEIENNQLLKGLLRAQGLPTDMSNHHMDEKSAQGNAPRNNNFNNNNGGGFNNNNQFGNFGGNNGNFNQAPQQNKFNQQQSNNQSQGNSFGNFNQPQQQQNQQPVQQNDNPFNVSPQQSAPQQSNSSNPFNVGQTDQINDDDLPFETKETPQQDDRQIDKSNMFKDAEVNKESGSLEDLSNTVNTESEGKASSLLDDFIKKGKESEQEDDDLGI
ncbi:hypothetical protein CPT_Madawaska_148 [Staphylococcus phage Madawaska]|nr:hypothetical protein CPT_Madawaska_148 [Staphylococcus phage Madawaska]